MDPAEIEKATAHIVAELVKYLPDAVVVKTILVKPTGNISVMSFDSGQGLTEETLPYDTFVQIIDGKAEIIIDGKSHWMQTGEGIILPAHQLHSIKSTGPFKMMLTVIKAGYE